MQDNLTDRLASSILILVLMALVLIAVHLVGKRVLAWAQSLKRVRGARGQQWVTLIHIVQWILVLLMVGSAVFILPGTFGLDVTPLLVSVGVAVLAVSLGAQSLIKAFNGGVLIPYGCTTLCLKDLVRRRNEKVTCLAAGLVMSPVRRREGVS